MQAIAKVGAHAFTAGGLPHGALSYVDKAAATAVQVFVGLVNHPSTADVPIIVETPGERHLADIALLRDLRKLTI